MRMNNCWLLAILLFAAIGVCQAFGQEEAPKPATPESTAAAGPARKELDKILEQWKALIGELTDLQEKYPDADQAEKEQIIEKYNKLVEKGDSMQPELAKATEKAYVEAPNQDKEVTDLLLQIASERMGADDYNEALRLSKLMLDKGCDVKGLNNLAGAAAFSSCDFDAAETYLKKAEEEKAINQIGKDYLAKIPEYKKLWAEETKLREAEAKADDLPRVLLKTTKGDIELELFENEAPIAVANFISLVEKGYYDGLTFHRVLPGFMAQGGCPKGDGTGGPGYNIPCECHGDNYRKHFQGSISMAHAGRDTGGSQFFLTFLPTAHLDGRHTVFGRVIKGMDVLPKLQRIDPSRPSGHKPDKIIKATVERKRNHEYKPTKVGE